MSYTITQQATTPNAAYTRLLYVVSGSTNTNKPLFQYVMDVYESGSNELIKRTTQTINPAGVAVFDPSRIMQGQLSDDYSWEISSVTPFDSSSKTFRLEFGEQFASSISSSAAVIDNIERTNTEVFRGVVEPNDGYFNWPSSSYAVLSNMPATMSMQNTDFGTIGVYNNDVSYISQSFYLSDGTLTEQHNYNVTDNFTSVPITTNNQNWNYADVSISSSIGLQSYRYKTSTDCNKEKVRFAFINKLGTWDYYNNYNPVRQAFEVKREQYTSPRVDYSSLTSVYNIERRGLNDYHNSIDDEFVTDTDLLDKTNANWIEELIESPSVYIQRNGEFIPIVITDSSYVANQNQARQKQFKYTITFKPSNQPFGKWEPEFITPSNLVLTTFDPLTDMPSGSLIYWWDFTDSSQMEISESNGISNITSILSKGARVIELSTGSTSKYTGGTYLPPTWEGDYSSFHGTLAGGGKHSTLASRYGIHSGSANGELELMLTSSEFTYISFIQPSWDTQTEVNDMIAYGHDDTAPNNSYITQIAFNRINNGLDVTTGYFSTTEAIQSQSSFFVNRTGGGFSNYGYSYSSSSLNGANPWESRVIRKTSDNVTDAYVGTIGRNPNETELPISGGWSNGNVINTEYFTVGGYPQLNQTSGTAFELAHILMYTGSLSNTQVNTIIDRFKNSVVYGSQVNKISN